MNQCLIGRNRATYAGQRCLLIGIGAADNCVNLEARGGLDEGLDAVEVRDAGQLDKNLIVTEAILLNDGLADTERSTRSRITSMVFWTVCRQAPSRCSASS